MLTKIIFIRKLLLRATKNIYAIYCLTTTPLAEMNIHPSKGGGCYLITFSNDEELIFLFQKIQKYPLNLQFFPGGLCPPGPPYIKRVWGLSPQEIFLDKTVNLRKIFP